MLGRLVIPEMQFWSQGQLLIIRTVVIKLSFLHTYAGAISKDVYIILNQVCSLPQLVSVELVFVADQYNSSC